MYKAFSKYPVNLKMLVCPCCVSESDTSNLYAKPLRDLEENNLLDYSYSAMLTWGNANDFKHYLPRIFELSSKRLLMTDTFIILSKLNYAKWTAWDKQEQHAILNFLRAWWKYDINNSEYFDDDVLTEINKITKNLSELLEDWNLDISTKGFKNYVELVLQYHYSKEFDKCEMQILNNWIKSNSFQLEAGLLKYKNQDEDFSEDILEAICVLKKDQ